MFIYIHIYIHIGLYIYIHVFIYIRPELPRYTTAQDIETEFVEQSSWNRVRVAFVLKPECVDRQSS